ASFKIKDSKGNYVTQKVFGVTLDTFTTNSKNQVVTLFGTKGEVTLPLELDAGTYFVEEIKTPEGFLELEEPVSFTITNQYDYDIDEEETPILTVKIKNAQPHGKLVIKKTDKVTADLLENVEYELTAKENIINAIDGSVIYKKGDVVSTGKTDAQGILTINNLPLGKYELKETLTNEGYVLSEEIKDIVFEQKDTTTKEYVINVNINNIKPHGEIHLEKTDKDTKELLGGVTFQLIAKEDIYSLDGRNTLIYKAGDTVSMDISEDGRYVTNELGQINITDLPLGHYELKEIETLEGYVPNDKVYDIDLSYDHSDKIIYTENINVENEKTTTEISKVDSTDEKELEGAHLSLKDKDGNVVEEWVSGKEPHIIRGLLVNEEYILHEDLAPIGYATASDVTFTVNADGTATKVTMKDEITKIDISKVDATTSKEIEGAKLTLTDKETGQVIETWTSKKEPHRIEGLEVGKTYVLHENLAPAGYEAASDVEFTINDTGEVQTVVMKDEAKKVIIQTGDSSQIGLYITISAVAGLGILTALRLRKKKAFEDE
ncbi:MAG: collagen binding domain-containing protein, partial [Faecalibacillus sp.]